MLEIQPVTILCTAINLLILYWFLKKFLFGRVNAILAQRAALVEEQLQSAKNDTCQAQELKAAYEEKQSHAKEEAAKIVSDAKNQAQRAYEKRLTEAEEDATRVLNEANAQIEADRAAMIRGARNEVAALALLAAAKVSGQSMNHEGETSMVESFLVEAGELK